MADLSSLFSRKWYCAVFHSGQHNGVYCDSGDPHPGCGYRWTTPPLTDEYARRYGLKAPLPFEVGDQIRYKLGPGPTRLGGVEPKHVVAITEEFIIYKVSSRSGKNLGEHILRHEDFWKNWEKGKADAL